MEETQSWINEKYLTLVLEASVEDARNMENGVHKIKDISKTTEGREINGIEVVDYEVKKALEDGKNYASLIYKVQVRYKHNTDEIKKKNYMIKKPSSMFIEWFVDRETETYKALRKVEQYISCKFSPQLYAYRENEMVMEDLTELGFENTNLKLFDYDHCEMALKKLAKFHAGTVLLHRNDPKLVEETIGYETFLTNSEKTFFIENFMHKVGDELSTWSGCEQYSGVFKYVGSNFKKYLEDLHKKDRYRVLNHGDFWLGNLMFKYDAGKVCDVVFVDFQNCRYAPPTCDIVYFIGSSADLDVRQNRLDELYSAYLEAFNDKLTELGISPAMTREQLENNLKEDYHIFFLGLWPLAILLNNPENVFSLDDIDSEMQHEFLYRFSGLMKTEQFRNFLSTILDDLDKQGLLQRFKE